MPDIPTSTIGSPKVEGISPFADLTSSPSCSCPPSGGGCPSAITCWFECFEPAKISDVAANTNHTFVCIQKLD